jgi:hypothetical protein
MRYLPSFTIAAALLFAPPLITASFAQSGSDVPPATARAAVPGPVAKGTIGTHTGYSVSPTSGTAGGGMATNSGMKAGGMAKSTVKKTKSVVILAP